LREELRLRVFESSVLIFGLKREEDGSWRKMYGLYSSSNIVRVSNEEG
jgi:hypothetical protein